MLWDSYWVALRLNYISLGDLLCRQHYTAMVQMRFGGIIFWQWALWGIYVKYQFMFIHWHFVAGSSFNIAHTAYTRYITYQAPPTGSVNHSPSVHPRGISLSLRWYSTCNVTSHHFHVTLVSFNHSSNVFN